jgi:HEAT repeat protein
MELEQIELDLQKQDFQYRLKAISALKDYPPAVAIPLLSQHTQDPEFLVRTFVARELGNQRTQDSFAALLQIVKFDNTPNVRAEAANSISLFGQISASHLVQIFTIDDHWLVRSSILLAMMDLECHAEVFELCLLALAGEDLPLQEAAIHALGTLSQSPLHMTSLSKLLSLKDSESPRLRVKVAYALQAFDEPEAKAAVLQLRQDPDHRVVGAAMENLVP